MCVSKERLRDRSIREPRHLEGQVRVLPPNKVGGLKCLHNVTQRAPERVFFLWLWLKVTPGYFGPQRLEEVLGYITQ